MQIVGPTAHKIEIAADIYFASRIFFMGSNFNNIPNLSFAINNLKWDTSMAPWQPQKVPRYLVYFQDSLMEVLLLSFFFFFFGVSSVNIAASSSWTSSPF